MTKRRVYRERACLLPRENLCLKLPTAERPGALIYKSLHTRITYTEAIFGNLEAAHWAHNLSSGLHRSWIAVNDIALDRNFVNFPNDRVNRPAFSSRDNKSRQRRFTDSFLIVLSIPGWNGFSYFHRFLKISSAMSSLSLRWWISFFLPAGCWWQILVRSIWTSVTSF